MHSQVHLRVAFFYLAEDPDGTTIVDSAGLANVQGWEGVALAGSRDGVLGGSASSGDGVVARLLGSKEEVGVTVVGGTSDGHVIGDVTLKSYEIKRANRSKYLCAWYVA